MCIKQTDIRIMELTSRLSKINDRVKEILGEKLTLMFKMDHGEIHPTLFMLKVNALDFEVMLLDEEVGEIHADFKATKLVEEMGLDYSEEDF